MLVGGVFVRIQYLLGVDFLHLFKVYTIQHHPLYSMFFALTHMAITSDPKNNGKTTHPLTTHSPTNNPYTPTHTTQPRFKVSALTRIESGP